MCCELRKASSFKDSYLSEDNSKNASVNQEHTSRPSEQNHKELILNLQATCT